MKISLIAISWTDEKDKIKSLNLCVLIHTDLLTLKDSN